MPAKKDTFTATDAGDDASLMAAVAAGDRRAFAQLVERHALKYRSLAFKAVGDTMMAEDIVQDCFVTVWQKADTFRPEKAKFTTWFHRMVMNRSIDQLRKHTPDQLAEGFDRECGDARQDQRFSEAQQSAILRTAIAELPERYQLVISLTYFEGMANKEVALAMGLKLKATESVLLRARKKLKSILSREGLGRDMLVSGFLGGRYDQ